ncbi:MAG: glycosyltransferase [Nitrospirae bacterium]|nr:glycosyltransferase [Nitrospirota bacterium]
MSKINLLHILSSLQIGGAEKQVVTLLKYLDKKKYRVILCCFHADGPLQKEIENEAVEIIILRMRLRYIFFALYKLIRLMKKEKIQIVHTHLYFDHLWGRIAARIAGVPVIMTTEHGRGMWKKRRHLFFEHIANRFTDMRIAVSEDIRQIRIQRELSTPEQVITIPNAINEDDFIVSDYVRSDKRKELGINRDDLVIGTVARFDPDKALDKLLEAAALVVKSIENVKIILVGNGPLRNNLEDHAARLRIADKVVFTGARTDIAELLSIMDVFVISSIREGIPVSLLEAMAAERAVVATNVGGNAEVINDESCGLIVEPNDTAALARGIISLLNDKALRERVGLKARLRIKEHFSVKSQVRKIESLYERILMSKLKSRKDK